MSSDIHSKPSTPTVLDRGPAVSFSDSQSQSPGQASTVLESSRDADPTVLEVSTRTSIRIGSPVTQQLTSSTVLQRLPTVLRDRFRIVRQFPTAGAEADVFLLEALVPTERPSEQVLKLYRRGVQPKQDVLERVRDGQFEHLIRIFEFGESDGHWFELMEHAPLGSLRTLLRDQSWGDVEVTLLVRELSEAISHLHELQLIHRDLKPENVLVRSAFPLDLVLADFGISSLAQLDLHVTTVNRTPRYAAPEALTGAVSHAADYWSLGIIVFEATVGQHPLAQLSDDRLVANWLVTRSIDLEALASRPAVQQLCRGLLQRDPARRWTEREVKRWLAQDETLIAPPLDEGLSSKMDTDLYGLPNGPRAQQPYEIGSCRCWTSRELGLALAANWSMALRDMQRGLVADWLTHTYSSDIKLKRLLMDLREREDDNEDDTLLHLILALCPDIPPTFRGFSLATCQDLLSLAAEAGKASEDEICEAARGVLDQTVAGGLLEHFSVTSRASIQPVIERLKKAPDENEIVPSSLIDSAEPVLQEKLQAILDSRVAQQVRVLVVAADPDRQIVARERIQAVLNRVPFECWWLHGALSGTVWLQDSEPCLWLDEVAERAEWWWNECVQHFMVEPWSLQPVAAAITEGLGEQKYSLELLAPHSMRTEVERVWQYLCARDGATANQVRQWFLDWLGSSMRMGLDDPGIGKSVVHSVSQWPSIGDALDRFHTVSSAVQANTAGWPASFAQLCDVISAETFKHFEKRVVSEVDTNIVEDLAEEIDDRTNFVAKWWGQENSPLSLAPWSTMPVQTLLVQGIRDEGVNIDHAIPPRAIERVVAVWGTRIDSQAIRIQRFDEIFVQWLTGRVESVLTRWRDALSGQTFRNLPSIDLAELDEWQRLYETASRLDSLCNSNQDTTGWSIDLHNALLRESRQAESLSVEYAGLNKLPMARAVLEAAITVWENCSNISDWLALLGWSTEQFEGGGGKWTELSALQCKPEDWVWWCQRFDGVTPAKVFNETLSSADRPWAALDRLAGQVSEHRVKIDQLGVLAIGCRAEWQFLSDLITANVRAVFGGKVGKALQRMGHASLWLSLVSLETTAPFSESSVESFGKISPAPVDGIPEAKTLLLQLQALNLVENFPQRFELPDGTVHERQWVVTNVPVLLPLSALASRSGSVHGLSCAWTVIDDLFCQMPGGDAPLRAQADAPDGCYWSADITWRNRKVLMPVAATLATRFVEARKPASYGRESTPVVDRYRITISQEQGTSAADDLISHGIRLSQVVRERDARLEKERQAHEQECQQVEKQRQAAQDKVKFELAAKRVASSIDAATTSIFPLFVVALVFLLFAAPILVLWAYFQGDLIHSFMKAGGVATIFIAFGAPFCAALSFRTLIKATNITRQLGWGNETKLLLGFFNLATWVPLILATAVYGLGGIISLTGGSFFPLIIGLALGAGAWMFWSLKLLIAACDF